MSFQVDAVGSERRAIPLYRYRLPCGGHQPIDGEVDPCDTCYCRPKCWWGMRSTDVRPGRNQSRPAPGWLDRALGWVEWALDAVGGFMAGPDGDRASRLLAYISIVALAVIVAAAFLWRSR